MSTNYCAECENEEIDDNKYEISSTSYGDIIFCDEDCKIKYYYGI
jgi:hypothetical protein